MTITEKSGYVVPSVGDRCTRSGECLGDHVRSFYCVGLEHVLRVDDMTLGTAIQKCRCAEKCGDVGGDHIIRWVWWRFSLGRCPRP